MNPDIVLQDLYDQAVAYSRLGKKDVVLGLCQRALALNPDFDSVHVQA